MAFCDDDSDNWILCDQKGHPGTIVDPDPCACPSATAERSMTLNQAQGIAETASLPGATGLPIGWNTDFYPTIPASVLPTSSSTAPEQQQHSTSASVTANANANATASSSSTMMPTASNPSPPPHSPTGFNTLAKVGTAIGACVVGIILLALLFFCITRCGRRRKKQQDLHNNEAGGVKASTRADPDPDPEPDPRTIGVAYGSGTNGLSQVSITSPRPSELDNKAARPWSVVSELDNGECDGGGGYARGQAHMDAIIEASRGHGEPGPSELEAPRGVVELPA